METVLSYPENILTFLICLHYFFQSLFMGFKDQEMLMF